MWFKSASEAFNFILSWDGRSVEELFDAILTVQTSKGTLFAPYLRDALKNLAARHCELGADVIAVDSYGHALAGELSSLVIRTSAP